MDNSQLIPVLSSEEDERYKKLKTIPHFSIHLLISTAISITGIILAATWTDQKRCEAYYIMIYLRAGFWLITLIFDFLVKRLHEKLRIHGYHDFHRATKLHKNIPMFVVNLWNTVILSVSALMQHYYGTDFGVKCVENWLSPIIYITSFQILEWVVLMFVSISYIVRVYRFNKAKNLPDAMLRSHSIGSVGLSQRSNGTMAELLEKQADQIQYLKDHNMKLNQKLLQINTQLRTVTLPAQPNI